MSGTPGSSPDMWEERIAELRAAVRRAAASGDRETARSLRTELRAAEQAWDEAVLGGDPAADAPVPPRAERGVPVESAGARERDGGAARGLVPVREQVHQALTLLGVPAAPKLIGAVHGAFFPGEIPATRLTSLRRDEERSFRSAPYARPYYLCAALTADLLAPARGLLTVSTWPLRQRVVGPLSARVDFLTAAIRVAERAEHTDTGRDAGVQRLLWRFAATIPGAADGTVGTDGAVVPAVVAEAARAELAVHSEADGRDRAAAARRAADVLD
ncbi:hypothetical protein, partial [Actinomadura harenae]